MTDLTFFAFNQNSIRFEKRNGLTWVSLTDMAKASGKKVNDFLRLSSTKELLNSLSDVTGNPVTSIIEIIRGESIPKNEQGTWGIEEVALEFAGWCSIQFKIWMLQKIKELLTTGKVEFKPETPQLPPADIRVTNLHTALTAFGFELDNPRHKQPIKDLISDILGLIKTHYPPLMKNGTV